MLYLSWPYIFALLNSVDPIYTPLSFEFLRPSKIIFLIIYMYRVSQISSPPTTFNDIFAWAESFCIKFYTLIGNLYPHTCTNFRLFILSFNKCRGADEVEGGRGTGARRRRRQSANYRRPWSSSSAQSA